MASHCLTRSFSTLTDQISEYLIPNGGKIVELQPNGTFVHPSTMEIPLAKFIPIINGLFSRRSLSDVLVQQLVSNENLKTLGANIYECFSCK